MTLSDSLFSHMYRPQSSAPDTGVEYYTNTSVLLLLLSRKTGLFTILLQSGPVKSAWRFPDHVACFVTGYGKCKVYGLGIGRRPQEQPKEGS